MTATTPAVPALQTTPAMHKITALAFALLLVAAAAPAQQQQQTDNLAPGAPGRDARWESAGKQGVGTSNTGESKVWFTLREGVMTDVYYPTVDVGNVRLLQFVVVSAGGRRVETEIADAHHRIESLDPQSLTFRQTNTAKSGAWTITKTYVTDPLRPVVLIDVEFKARGHEQLYVYYDPSLNNSGMHDSAWTLMDGVSLAGELSRGGAMLASDADKASALVFGPRPAGRIGRFSSDTNGYFETSDGLTELRRGGRLTRTYLRAADGNVVQVAQIPLGYPDAAVNALRKRQPARESA
ncbi:MAG TPA: hypothetical protein VEQ42_05025, partial [Pyrinomonadaceae bacterium]|nr:hypothetical protein [Pyrinomonadaceae bacterium]